MASLQSLYDQSVDQKTSNPSGFEAGLINVIKSSAVESDENLKIKENSFYTLAEHYRTKNDAKGIQKLIEDTKDIINGLPKVKSANVIKKLIEIVEKIPNTLQIQVDLCDYLVKWARAQNIAFIRHRMEIKLSNLYLLQTKFQKSIELITPLLDELRKADDKHLLIEAWLIESKVHFKLENYPKSKASLTAARASSNQIYIQPTTQAEIDMQQGILLCQEGEYKTSYGYFFEAYEALDQNEDVRAIQALKYMILSRIMTNSNDDISALLSGKHGLKYQGIHLEAMKAIAKANQNKSLTEFRSYVTKYDEQINGDEVIKQNLEQLYENLLEQNLQNIIEPYSRVQIDHIAKAIQLDHKFVMNKLSEMILDKKIEGTLDQGVGCLIVFDDLKSDELYPNALDLIKSMNGVVDKLFDKAKTIKR